MKNPKEELIQEHFKNYCDDHEDPAGICWNCMDAFQKGFESRGLNTKIEFLICVVVGVALGVFIRSTTF